jgi:hypothetical protein
VQNCDSIGRAQQTDQPLTPTRHYTGHFKAVVTKPQNVMIMRDVACAGYVAGMNTTFFARNPGAKTYSLETARQNMQDRLSFADDVGAKYGSMLAFPATEQQLEANQGFDTVMSVTSRLLPWELTGPNARDHSSFPGGQAVYKEYDNKLGLSGVHYGEDMKAAENQDFISQARQSLNLTRTFEPVKLKSQTLSLCVRRARQTTRRAFWARTASTTRSRAASCRSYRARATLAPTPSLG